MPTCMYACMLEGVTHECVCSLVIIRVCEHAHVRVHACLCACVRVSVDACMHTCL